MFKCAVTGKTTAPREKQNKVVVKTRSAEYIEDRFDAELNRYVRVVVGTGHETVREVNVSDEGLALIKEGKVDISSL